MPNPEDIIWDDTKKQLSPGGSLAQAEDAEPRDETKPIETTEQGGKQDLDAEQTDEAQHTKTEQGEKEAQKNQMSEIREELEISDNGEDVVKENMNEGEAREENPDKEANQT